MPRCKAQRSGGIDRAIEELRELDVSRPDWARRRALQVLRQLAGSDAAAWYTLGEWEGAPRPTRWLTSGRDDYRLRARQGFERLQWKPTPWGVGDPRRPRPSWTRSFICGASIWGDWGRYRETAFYRHFFYPLGVEDNLRLLVYRSGRFVGWIGVGRLRGEPLFRRSDARRLGPLVAPMAAVLTAAEAAEQPTTGGYVVATPRGRCELMSPDARAWIGRHASRERLGALVRSIDRGAGEGELRLGGALVRWQRMYRHDRPAVRYLLHLSPPPAVHVAPDAALSPAQREVAQLAACGASNREIARLLDVRIETVRTHMREAYRRLGVKNRVELARCVA